MFRLFPNRGNVHKIAVVGHTKYMLFKELFPFVCGCDKNDVYRYQK